MELIRRLLPKRDRWTALNNDKGLRLTKKSTTHNRDCSGPTMATTVMLSLTRNHAAPPETDSALDSLSAPENDLHPQYVDSQYDGQYAHRLEEHDTPARQENAHRPHPPLHRELVDDDDHAYSTLSGDDSEGQEATLQGCGPDNQEHDAQTIQDSSNRAPHPSNQQPFTHDDNHSRDARAAQGDSDCATHSLNRQLFANDDGHSPDARAIQEGCASHSSNQQPFTHDDNHSHDSRADQEDTDCATHSSRRQPLANDDNHSLHVQAVLQRSAPQSSDRQLFAYNDGHSHNPRALQMDTSRAHDPSNRLNDDNHSSDARDISEDADRTPHASNRQPFVGDDNHSSDARDVYEDTDHAPHASTRQLFVSDDNHSSDAGDIYQDTDRTPHASTRLFVSDDNHSSDARDIYEDTDRTPHASTRQLFVSDDNRSSDARDIYEDTDRAPHASTRQLFVSDDNHSSDARDIYEDTDRASHASNRQRSSNDDYHSHNTLSEDDYDGGESTQHGNRPYSPEQDTLTVQENMYCTTPPPNQQLYNNEDRHFQNTLIKDGCETEESTQRGYWPDSPVFHDGPIESPSPERARLSTRNGRGYPQEIDRGYRAETVVVDMASLPNNGNQYCADEEFMTPVMDRPQRNRTTPPIADGFESDDESDDYYAMGYATNSPSTSARRPQLITHRESSNPFLHIPEPQNAETIHRERARRRAEARDNLGYVIRGQKYLIFPSLYEESEDPELYGSTVLWPSESTRNDADFTFSCPSAQNLETAEVDEDEDDEAAAAKYGITLLPIPKRTEFIPNASRAGFSEDEDDHHHERSSGDSLARPFKTPTRPPRTIIDLSAYEDEDADATLAEAYEEDPSTESSTTLRVSEGWSGSTKRPSEDIQPERASKVLIDHSRQPSFAGPFEALVERAPVERGGPQFTFDFSVNTMPTLPKPEEEPKWYRLSKSTVTTRVDPREELAFTIPSIDAASGQNGAAKAEAGEEAEEEAKAEEEPRWYRLSKSTTTVRVEPREEAMPCRQGGGGPSGSHRGYGSSTYGSGDEDSDSGALNRSFDFEFKPGQPLSGSTSRLAIQRPEKHRLEPDTCDLRGGGGGGGEHACSAFDSCWGTRRAVVGLYHWDDEEWREGREEWVEGRKDKRFVLIRDPANDN
ncbi:hypothetical protein BGZ68_009830 [Mortierella alpina]|nr:hypothetical protein BGZ68_009830 [Mortierella alpina]